MLFKEELTDLSIDRCMSCLIFSVVRAGNMHKKLLKGEAEEVQMKMKEAQEDQKDTPCARSEQWAHLIISDHPAGNMHKEPIKGEPDEAQLQMKAGQEDPQDTAYAIAEQRAQYWKTRAGAAELRIMTVMWQADEDSVLHRYRLEQAIHIVIPQYERSKAERSKAARQAAQEDQNDILNTAPVVDGGYEIHKDWMIAEADGPRMKRLKADEEAEDDIPYTKAEQKAKYWKKRAEAAELQRMTLQRQADEAAVLRARRIQKAIADAIDTHERQSEVNWQHDCSKITLEPSTLLV